MKNYPEYQQPDPLNPDKQLWETFNYELACAELCGKGHFSMRRAVRIVEEAEYAAWARSQKSFYETSIQGTADDPFLEATSLEATPEVAPAPEVTEEAEAEASE